MLISKDYFFKMEGHMSVTGKLLQLGAAKIDPLLDGYNAVKLPFRLGFNSLLESAVVGA